QPREEKLKGLADPACRAQLSSEAHQSGARVFDPDRLHYDENPGAGANEDVRGLSLREAASRRGVEDPFQLMFDIAASEGLATPFVTPADGDDPDTWRRRVDVWRDPRTIVGGSDAGAHL